jgi:hypothetical protein
MSTAKKTTKTIPNPNPQPSAPNPGAAPPPPASPPQQAPPAAASPPITNAALAAYVQQAVALFDSLEQGLGADPALTPTQKRHSSKMRKGGQSIALQIGNLVDQHGLESPALPVSDITGAIGRVQALQPLANRVSAFLKHVNDIVFTAESTAWVDALQLYALLQRRASTDTELATSLAPITQFFAYRHPSTKKPGAPTKRQRKATAKAVKTLKQTAPDKLAQPSAASPAAPAAPAASAPAPAAPAAASPVPAAPAPQNSAPTPTNGVSTTSHA